jgi:hypothetical protein
MPSMISAQDMSIARAADSLCHDGKTGAAVRHRANLDPMPEAAGRPFDDEEPEAEAVRPRRIESEKRLEYGRQFVWRDPLAAIPNLDPKRRSTPTAADEDTPAGQRMIERIAREIAQDAVE